jgi:hypothetical protein
MISIFLAFLKTCSSEGEPGCVGGSSDGSRVEGSGVGELIVTLLRRVWLWLGVFRPKSSVVWRSFSVGLRTRWELRVGLSLSESIALYGRLLWRDRWLMADVFFWVFLCILKVCADLRVASTRSRSREFGGVLRRIRSSHWSKIIGLGLG